MNKLPFVIWLLGWPVAFNLTDYLAVLSSGRPTTDLTSGGVAVFLAVWVFVGVLCYPSAKS